MKWQTLFKDQWNIKLPKDRANIFLSGWEKKRMDHLLDNVEENDVVYYIGSEIGDMPAMLAVQGAEVALFEPSEHYWQQTKKIWEKNKLKKPIFFWSGFASNKTRRQKEAINWEDIDMDYKNPKNLGFRELDKEGENFPQIKIDDVIKFVIPPTIMSIDVEGSEFEVLKGAKNTLIEYKPKIYLSLHPEFLFHQWGVYANDVRNYLKDLGYRETLIDYPPHEVHFYYE